MNEMVQTDEQTIDYVEGRGDSFAQRVWSYRYLSKADSCWVVKGDEAILDQQEEGELAFHANLKGEEIVKHLKILLYMQEYTVLKIKMVLLLQIMKPLVICLI